MMDPPDKEGPVDPRTCECGVVFDLDVEGHWDRENDPLCKECHAHWWAEMMREYSWMADYARHLPAEDSEEYRQQLRDAGRGHLVKP